MNDLLFLLVVLKVLYLNLVMENRHTDILEFCKIIISTNNSTTRHIMSHNIITGIILN